MTITLLSAVINGRCLSILYFPGPCLWVKWGKSVSSGFDNRQLREVNLQMVQVHT